MQITDISTERTTAATDLLLALIAGLAVAYVCRLGMARDAWKAALWAWVFGLLALAALLGALSHGLQLSDRTRNLIWQPLNAALGLMIVLLVVAVVLDAWGLATARRTLPFAIAIGLGFYGLTLLLPRTFLVFVLFEAVAMLFSLVVYVLLAVRGELAGAPWMAAGIAITLTAAAIQASEVVLVHLIWTFDHNGVFHLLQAIACLVLLIGLRSAFLAMTPVG